MIQVIFIDLLEM
ncbi:unnamed protein product, partial [Rotaria magnacalcarata]